ncbi:hypothetical protein [Mesorhizobium sp. Cs1299R1N3]|uniref:hypothetical protein n=1 Tax=Mesorhizobium sp. Cs1299R1N3 TaxID=3015173 RepID=UPI00301D136B
MLNAFVDPPTPFAPLEEWIAFRAEMAKIKPRTADVEKFIRDADETIKRLKKDAAA